MPAYIYANGQYHALPGNKIAKSGQLLTMKDTDAIILNGTSYSLGVSSGASSANYSSVFMATEEPSTGTAHYITPDGSGTMDGLSWANAASGSMVHIVLLQCASGDRIYFAEGSYTTSRIIEIPPGVALYGGFRSSDSYAWSGRNPFSNPTKFTMEGTSPFAWATNNSASYTLTVDGFWIDGYSGTLIGNGTFQARNIYADSGVVSINGEATHCVFKGISSTITCTHLIESYVLGCSSQTEFVLNGSANGVVFANCTAYKIVNNNHNYYLFAYVNKFYNCTCDYISCYIGIGKLIAINCTVRNKVINNNINNSLFNSLFVNCSIGNGCKSCFSTAVNCVSQNYIFITPSDCIQWNCQANGIASGTANAQSDVVSGYTNAVTLGSDNTIARFTNTGFFPAKGVQDVGNCPDPILDTSAFNAWIAAFGDWHPLANSFLVGNGTANNLITTDIDGVARPNPTTIGCYEPVPSNGGNQQ